MTKKQAEEVRTIRHALAFLLSQTDALVKALEMTRAKCDHKLPSGKLAVTENEGECEDCGEFHLVCDICGTTLDGEECECDGELQSANPQLN